MKRMVNRFWDWIFHPSVQRQVHRGNKTNLWFYPTMGNAPQGQRHAFQHRDFKTPYESSQYNVRHKVNTIHQEDDVQSSFYSPLGETSIMRLKRTGFLKKGEENNPDAVQKAKQLYTQHAGVSPQSTHNAIGLEIQRPRANRQQIAASIENVFKQASFNVKSGLHYTINRQSVHDPETVPLESLDLFSDPHFQEGRVANEYMIQEEMKETLDKGQIQMNMGSANFWKPIDAQANEKGQIEKVNIQVSKTEQPLNYHYNGPEKAKMDIDKDGNVTDIHPTYIQRQ